MSNTEQPLDVLQFEDNDDIDDIRYTRITYGCANCGMEVIPFERRCSKCEQMLSWDRTDVRWEI